jgi:hypothetical protein
MNDRNLGKTISDDLRCFQRWNLDAMAEPPPEEDKQCVRFFLKSTPRKRLRFFDRGVSPFDVEIFVPD